MKLTGHQLVLGSRDFGPANYVTTQMSRGNSNPMQHVQDNRNIYIIKTAQTAL